MWSRLIISVRNILRRIFYCTGYLQPTPLQGTWRLHHCRVPGGYTTSGYLQATPLQGTCRLHHFRVPAGFTTAGYLQPTPLQGTWRLHHFRVPSGYTTSGYLQATPLLTYACRNAFQQPHTHTHTHTALRTVNTWHGALRCYIMETIDGFDLQHLAGDDSACHIVHIMPSLRSAHEITA